MSIEIEVLGDGNCGYYAYAISLMYYLRQKNQSTIDLILSRFTTLSDDHLSTLNKIIRQNDKSRLFSDAEHKSITNCLAPAVRSLAGSAIKNEFISNPNRSQIFHNLTYALRKVYAELLISQPDYFDLIQAPSKVNQSFETAELFKVQGMRHLIQRHGSKSLNDLITQYRAAAEIKEPGFQPYVKMEELIWAQVVDFFENDNYKNLDAYVTHLQTNYQWLSEETLLSLHEHIMGRQETRDENENVHIIYEADIPLQISTDNPSAPNTANADIILKHCNQNHWVPCIPSHLIPTPTVPPIASSLVTPSTPTTPLTQLSLSSSTSSTPRFFKDREKIRTRLLSSITIKDENKESMVNSLIELLNDETLACSDTDNLDMAKAHQNETDENFAIRLQVGYLKSFLA